MSDFERCRAGVWALEVLGRAGLNDSPAADAIRDAMDGPWYRLSLGQQGSLTAFSAELGKGDRP